MTAPKQDLLRSLDEREFYDMVYAMSKCLHAMLYVQDKYVSRYRQYRCVVQQDWRFLCVRHWRATLFRKGCEGHAISAGGFSCDSALKKLNTEVQDAHMEYLLKELTEDKDESDD
jgi:hypothetical protein